MGTSPICREELRATKETKFLTGSHLGEPAIFISHDQESNLLDKFKNAVIGKFYRGKPNVEALRNFFKTNRFTNVVQVGMLRPNIALMRFDSTEDFNRCRTRGSWFIDGLRIRVSKWSPDTDFTADPSSVPVWMRLPNLPFYLFEKNFIFSIAMSVGEPIMIDEATSTASRPNLARVCIDVDLRKHLPSRIWIQNGKKGFWQYLQYEKVPQFCSCCGKIGHTASYCRMNSSSGLNVPGSPEKHNIKTTKARPDLTKAQSLTAGVESLSNLTSDSVTTGKKFDEPIILFGDFAASMGNEFSHDCVMTKVSQTMLIQYDGYDLCPASSSSVIEPVEEPVETADETSVASISGQKTDFNAEELKSSQIYQTPSVANHFAEIDVSSSGFVVEMRHSKEIDNGMLDSRIEDGSLIESKSQQSKNTTKEVKTGDFIVEPVNTSTAKEVSQTLEKERDSSSASTTSEFHPIGMVKEFSGIPFTEDRPRASKKVNTKKSRISHELNWSNKRKRRKRDKPTWTRGTISLAAKDLLLKHFFNLPNTKPKLIRKVARIIRAS